MVKMMGLPPLSCWIVCGRDTRCLRFLRIGCCVTFLRYYHIRPRCCSSFRSNCWFLSDPQPTYWFQVWEFSASMTYIVTFRLDNLAFLFMLAKFLKARPRRLQVIREHRNSGSDFSREEHLSRTIPVFQWGLCVRHESLTWVFFFL